VDVLGGFLNASAACGARMRHASTGSQRLYCTERNRWLLTGDSARRGAQRVHFGLPAAICAPNNGVRTEMKTPHRYSANFFADAECNDSGSNSEQIAISHP